MCIFIEPCIFSVGCAFQEDANKEIVVISTERPPSVNDNQAEEEKEEKLSRTGSQPLDPNIMEADAESVKKVSIISLCVNSSDYLTSIFYDCPKDEAEQPEAPEERPESIAESRSVSRLGGTPRGQPAVNQVLASLLMQDENQQAQLGVEEV